LTHQYLNLIRTFTQFLNCLRKIKLQNRHFAKKCASQETSRSTQYRFTHADVFWNPVRVERSRTENSSREDEIIVFCVIMRNYLFIDSRPLRFSERDPLWTTRERRLLNGISFSPTPFRDSCRLCMENTGNIATVAPARKKERNLLGLRLSERREEKRHRISLFLIKLLIEMESSERTIIKVEIESPNSCYKIRN